MLKELQGFSVNAQVNDKVSLSITTCMVSVRSALADNYCVRIGVAKQLVETKASALHGTARRFDAM